jgi:hypothetical protein
MAFHSQRKMCGWPLALLPAEASRQLQRVTEHWPSKNHSMIGFTGPFTYIVIYRLYRNMVVQLPCPTNYYIHSGPCANVHVAS